MFRENVTFRSTAIHLRRELTQLAFLIEDISSTLVYRRFHHIIALTPYYPFISFHTIQCVAMRFIKKK